MATTPETIAFERGIRPILQIVLLDKADAVLNFRPDPTLQDRIEELAAKSTEGELTDQERAEYEGYVERISSLLSCSDKHGSSWYHVVGDGHFDEGPCP